MRLLFPFLFLFIVSCSQNNKYEYILKEDNFKYNFELNKDQSFVDLEEGFTFYNATNQNSQKTPVVLIHGFSVPSYIWDPTFVMLREKGFYIISLDLYGRGNSKNIDGDYTDELFANQVLQLLNHLEIEKADFVGLSNGGRVISKIADINSDIVGDLIYVASSSFLNKSKALETDVSKKEVREFIGNNYPTIAKGQLQDFKYPEKFEGWDDKYEELLKYKGFARALISTTKNHYTMDEIHENINNLNLPVYTIWGDSDNVVVYDEFSERLNELLPNRNEYFISNSGHLPHMENQDEFNKVILSILND
ncbi:MAG: alpha/beta fold hydrolase [Flavobacteriaceae bacterium]